MEASIARKPVSEWTNADLRAHNAAGWRQIRDGRDREWELQCDRVLDAIRFAAYPQTRRFYGYYGYPEIEAARMVKLLVRRGRKEGRIDADQG